MYVLFKLFKSIWICLHPDSASKISYRIYPSGWNPVFLKKVNLMFYLQIEWKQSLYPKYHFVLLINLNMKFEIKIWFETEKIKISGFPIFKITELWNSSLFFVFHFNLKNEKQNLLKQISYETSYHSPYVIIMNEYKRIK